MTRYPVVLFDWGNTVMRDDPAMQVPMVEWPEVWAIDGILEVLAHLHSTGRRCILATSADISDEGQIRGALDRVGAARFFERIYSFTNTGLHKGEDFYRFILQDLGILASDALMIGDSFEADVQAPNRLGIHAVWFNPLTAETRQSPLHETVHSMAELLRLLSNP
jgi:putative hydrolase of the HAD superfamily